MINFKIKLNLKKDCPDCDIETILNRPITIKDKCIGVVTDYDLNTNEISGLLFNITSINLSQDKKTICSIEII